MNVHRFSSGAKSKCRSGSWWCLLLLAIPCLALGLTDEEMQRGNPIFVGTVLELGAVSFHAVPVSNRTATVRVDHVLLKPEGMGLRVDDTVTVELKDRSAPKPGSQATFATVAWISGKGLALREIGHDLVAAAFTVTSIQATRELIEEAKLSARVNAADVVIKGKVTSIRVAATNSTQTYQPISEHSPNWQEAIIQVDEGLKGMASNTQVVVRFPNSMDVHYFGVPRFTVGQDGIFLLSIDESSGLPQAMLAGSQVSSYLAPTAGDVLPPTRISAIRTVLGK